VDRLIVYNGEFETFESLENIVDKFNEDINNEISQRTGEKPCERFKKEQEYLNPLPPMDCIISYFHHEKEYKVTQESMINYKGKKYSVPTRFIGRYLNVTEIEDELSIYYTTDLIVCHKRSDKFLNYKIDHAIEILKSEALTHMSNEDIDEFIENNLRNMDIFLN